MGKKKGISDKVRNRKKNKALAPVNPFEIKINKVKHTVVNKKVQKWEKGAPGVSRSKALKLRKDTLLRELHHIKKSNVLHDKRFGENDTNLTADEKMVQRFALEKKRQAQKGDFNLKEEEETLTHYGQSLAENLQDTIESDSDEDKEDVRTGDLQFGGFSNDSELSWKDKMNQVIAESKKHKYERQAEKEKTVEKSNELDGLWKTVLQNLVKDKPVYREVKQSSYRALCHTLVQEQKTVGASDKTKTEDEIAKEEAEKLKQLESDRLARMRGTAEFKKTSKHVSADDLNDCFALDSDKPKVRFADEKRDKSSKNEGDNEEDDEESDDEKNEGNDNDEEEESSDESGDEDDSDAYSDLESDENSGDESEEDKDDKSEEDEEVKKSDEDTEKAISKKKTNKNTKSILKNKTVVDSSENNKKNELPFVFKAPGSFGELESLLHGHSWEEQAVIVSRLRKCHHPSLAEGNKAKLERIHLYILQYFGKMAAQPKLEPGLLHCLTGHVWELTQTFPSATAKALQMYLSQRQAEHTQHAQRHGGRGVLPRTETLLHLTLVDSLFPTSDFRHPVATPALTFISQALAECIPRSLKDVLLGICLCSVALKYVSLSKRYVPEVITFIHGLLCIAFTPEKASSEGLKFFPPFKASIKAMSILSIEESCDEYKDTISLSDLSTLDENEGDHVVFKASAMASLMGLMGRCLDMWSDLPSAREATLPWCTCLAALPRDNYPQALQEKLISLLERLENVKPKLQAMQQEAKKPVPLKLFEPKIEEFWSGKRKKGGPNREVNERQRLVHKHKRELKATVRELKRDNAVLARHQLDQAMAKDAERKRKTKELLSSLANQEGDYKAIKRVKRD